MLRMMRKRFKKPPPRSRKPRQSRVFWRPQFLKWKTPSKRIAVEGEPTLTLKEMSAYFDFLFRKIAEWTLTLPEVCMMMTSDHRFEN
jgi:hypothetical protein